MENLDLWKQVEKTDPNITKGFKGKGGFKGTAVDAQSQRKKATELFGPFGLGWKVDEEKYNLIQLDPSDAHYSKVFYTAILSYDYNGTTGAFPIASEIDAFNYSRNYDSWTMGNDLYKKVRTDAMTKGLSELGFNSDIFEGKFDDSKYVDQLIKEKNQKDPYDLDRAIKKMEACKDIASLIVLWKKLFNEFDGSNEEKIELVAWKDKRKKELV